MNSVHGPRNRSSGRDGCSWEVAAALDRPVVILRRIGCRENERRSRLVATWVRLAGDRIAAFIAKPAAESPGDAILGHSDNESAVDKGRFVGLPTLVVSTVTRCRAARKSIVSSLERSNGVSCQSHSVKLIFNGHAQV